MGAGPAFTDLSRDLAFQVVSITGDASVGDLGLGGFETIAALCARYDTPIVFLNLNAQSWRRSGMGSINTKLELNGSTLDADPDLRSELVTTLLDQQVGCWLPIEGPVRTGVVVLVSQALTLRAAWRDLRLDAPIGWERGIVE